MLFLVFEKYKISKQPLEVGLNSKTKNNFNNKKYPQSAHLPKLQRSAWERPWQMLRKPARSRHVMLINL
jgi:hypothetical protein